LLVSWHLTFKPILPLGEKYIVLLLLFDLSVSILVSSAIAVNPPVFDCYQGPELFCSEWLEAGQ
jgi:hypothetical protein